MTTITMNDINKHLTAKGKCGTAWAEWMAANNDLRGPDANGEMYLYVETGTYKPYSEATVSALRRRGWRTDKRMDGVWYLYPPKKD